MDSLLANQIYTGSENNDITNTQISLNFPITENDEIVMNPRSGGVDLNFMLGHQGLCFYRTLWMEDNH